MDSEPARKLPNGHPSGVSSEQFRSIGGVQTGLRLNKIVPHRATLIRPGGGGGATRRAAISLENTGISDLRGRRGFEKHVLRSTSHDRRPCGRWGASEMISPSCHPRPCSSTTSGASGSLGPWVTTTGSGKCGWPWRAPDDGCCNNQRTPWRRGRVRDAMAGSTGGERGGRLSTAGDRGEVVTGDRLTVGACRSSLRPPSGADPWSGTSSPPSGCAGWRRRDPRGDRRGVLPARRRLRRAGMVT